MPNRRTFLRLSCAMAAVAALGNAQAGDAWPAGKPITWIVGFSAGGSVDAITRAIAQRVGASLKQNIVVENRAGASGGIAQSAAAKAEPDGYTLVTVPGPILRAGDVPDIGSKLDGIATLAEGAVVLVGRKDGPRDIRQLIAAIKQEPARFSYASSGMGTGQHIAGEMFNLALDTGKAVVHVPYKGGSQAIADILGGQVQLGFLGVSTVLPQIRQGKLTAYAVTTPYRIDVLPDVPTFQEAGVPDFTLTQWYVAAAPAGMPEDTRTKLKQAIQQALRSPEVLEMLASNGLNLPSAQAQDATAYARLSIQRAQQVARDAHIVLQ